MIGYYMRYSTFSAIRHPSPSKLWVFLDESPILLNDCAFGFRMNESMWVDAPGAYHNAGCGFTFADGHAEIHKWKSAGTGHFVGSTAYGSSSEGQDYLWMEERTSASRH